METQLKRKVQIFLIAGVTVLSGISGVTALLGTGSTTEESGAGANIQLNQAGRAPIAIASNSWGGRAAGSDDDDGTGRAGTDGNSWGG